MLQKAKMVARKYFEQLYDCTCDVIENKEMLQSNKSTFFEEVKVIKNQPCKISYEKISTISLVNDNSAEVPLSIKLFISPDIKIKSGSKIIVTAKDGSNVSYKSSGSSAKYDTHQEIMLELFDRWS